MVIYTNYHGPPDDLHVFFTPNAGRWDLVNVDGINSFDSPEQLVDYMHRHGAITRPAAEAIANAMDMIAAGAFDNWQNRPVDYDP